jgi:hypothetical protein
MSAGGVEQRRRGGRSPIRRLTSPESPISNRLMGGDLAACAKTTLAGWCPRLAVLALRRKFPGPKLVTTTTAFARSTKLTATLLTQNGTIVGNTALVSFGCSQCPLLQSNTQYWVVAVPTSLNNEVIWYFVTSALGNAYFSNDLSNVGAVDDMWSSAGQSFPTPAFLVDGAASAPAPAPALSELALVLLVVLLTLFGARSLQRSGS